MTINTLRDYLTRRPFEPFRVITFSGQGYDVRHPDAAILMRDGLLLAYGGDNGGLPELSAHLSLLHIVAVESLPAARRRRARR